MSARLNRAIGFWAGLALLLAAGGCQERTTSKGWASEVPANAVRYVTQAPPAQSGEAQSGEATSGDAQSGEATSGGTKSGEATFGGTPPGEVKPAPKTVREYAKDITEPTRIVVWHSYRAGEKEAFNQVIDAWNALGTKISVKSRSVPFDAFNDKIQIVVPRGRGPDLFIFAHDTIGTWAEMNLIEPLNEWVDESEYTPFLENTVSALVYQEALYGLPLAFKSVALLYNKKLIPVPPKTFEELVTIAKKFTSKDRYGLVYEAANLYFHAGWIAAFGGRVLDDKGAPVLNDEAGIKALELVARLVKTEGVTPRSVSSALVSGYFNEGTAAMVINGPWMRGEIEGVDYGVVPLPTVDGRPAKPFLGVEALYLNKQSPRKKAAMEVARFLVSEASAKIRFEVGKQPVANRAVWEAAGEGLDPRMKGFLEQAKTSTIMPSSPNMQQLWSPYNGALLSVLAGDVSPKAALDEAQRDAERAIARAKGGGQ